MRAAWRVVATCSVVMFVAALAAQDQKPAAATPPAQAGTLSPALAAKIEAWFKAGQPETERQALIPELLRERTAAMHWLAAQMREHCSTPNARGAGIQWLARNAAVATVDQEAKSGMLSIGQYSDLQPLVPFVTELFLELLLATPDWFPDNHRERLVHPLRELVRTAPKPKDIAGMIEIVRDRVREPDSLRDQLSFALHQWGHPEFVAPLVQEALARTTEGDIESRVLALKNLAGIYYQIRDFKQLCAVHRTIELLAEREKIDLRPSDFYAAACAHALNGDRERALVAFERCMKRHADVDLDKSWRIDRKQLLRDPELLPLRDDPRFQAALKAGYAGGD